MKPDDKRQKNMKHASSRFGVSALFALIMLGLGGISQAEDTTGSKLDFDALLKAHPNLKKIFDGESFDGWEADPSTWSIVDGAIHGTAGTSRLVYTKKDYGSFRVIFNSRMDPEKRIIPGPICMMRHGGGTSIYKDVYVEENPTEDQLITVIKSDEKEQCIEVSWNSRRFIAKSRDLPRSNRMKYNGRRTL